MYLSPCRCRCASICYGLSVDIVSNLMRFSPICFFTTSRLLATTFSVTFELSYDGPEAH